MLPVPRELGARTREGRINKSFLFKGELCRDGTQRELNQTSRVPTAQDSASI